MSLDRTQYTRLQGLYKGTVVQHLRSGRCKIFIPGIYPEEWGTTAINKLPPAEQISPMFAGSFGGNGVFSYPSLGSIVACGFWNGDSNLPYYFGAIQSDDTAMSSYVDYAQIDATDKTVQDGTDAPMHSIVVKNSVIKFNEAGEIKLMTKGSESDKNFTCISQDSHGNISIVGNGTVYIKCNDFKVDADNKIELVSPDVEIRTLGTGVGPRIHRVQVKTDQMIEDAVESYAVNSPKITLNANTGKPAGSVVAFDGEGRPVPIAAGVKV